MSQLTGGVDRDGPFFLHEIRSARVYEEAARLIRALSESEGIDDGCRSAIAATDLPVVITNPALADNPIVHANAAFEKLTGFAVEEVIGRNCRFMQGPATDRVAIARLRAAVAAQQPIDIEILNYKRDGTAFLNRLLVTPVPLHEGGSVLFLAVQWDVALGTDMIAADSGCERHSTKHASDAFMASNLRAERLRQTLSAGGLGSWWLDLETDDYQECETCRSQYGRSDLTPVTFGELETSVHPDDRERRRAALRQALEAGKGIDVDFRVSTSAGEERWIHLRGQADHRADGTPMSLAGISQDVTARRRVEERRALLSNELSHRVKNMLAMLQAVVAQTVRSSKSLQEAARTLDTRIQAIVAATDLLVHERPEAADLRDVISRSLAPFGIEDARRVDVKGMDLTLPAQLAAALSLTLYELATNATKYGALSTATGSVLIKWHVINDPSSESLRLDWIERNGPEVSPPDKKGFGTLLIQQVLKQDLGSEIDILYLPEGIEFTAVMPLIEPPGMLSPPSCFRTARLEQAKPIILDKQPLQKAPQRATER
ncbi:HWE histidine kinase domain-containing protein [Sphingomonas morindae]|uniref:histidine kinase n=1 Tax=Sphingomonas morindae TaxID=1541170 RepID=A0ABY4XA97_9SPHN|nr:HWE histidine kinase domain-containing protein [Sphingomonas morindae]USI73888.1 PAS domain-containing protein [Sphingomonas morindae]